uniref:Dihydrofolate synthase/folylpolyglutamate synthase n=1 Tax=Caldicellulosiruptor owensensis TaxID=55205 RepID=A0A7C5V2X5_9FIRM
MLKMSMTYEQALDFIHSTYKFGTKLGLQNIRKLLEFMGNPQKGLKVIHIAGTNGKGSTCAFINQMLIEAGFRVGLYTSPFLESFNERIKFNNQPIGNQELASITEFVKEKIEEMLRQGFSHPTEFEVVTAIGFEFFKRKNVDFVVLEVGLGGRFDATNVVENPELCIITSIGFDHMDILGPTIEKIAYEKAGIIKRNSKVILGVQRHKGVREIISKVCKQQSAQLIEVEEDYHVLKNALDGIVFDCVTPRGIYKNLEIKLLGTHQIENALNCIYAYECLREKYDIKIEALVRGLLNARWNGRFEVFMNSPLVVLDGAHNVDGMRMLIENCKMYLSSRRIVAVVGILKDKEYEKMISLLKNLTGKIIFTLVPYQKRAFSEEEALDVSNRFGLEFIADFKYAIKYALGLCGKDGAVIICGSLYLVGAARSFLKNMLSVL